MKEFETYWRNLGGKEAAVAYQAIAKLTAASNQSVELLRGRLSEQDRYAPKRIATLLNRLDDEQFSVREKATAELAKLGERAEPALRNALANRPSLEVRRRVESLLENLEGLPVSPDTLRQTRAIVVLEAIDTMEAQHLLKSLAHSTPETWIMREAKASLERLAARRRAGKR